MLVSVACRCMFVGCLCFFDVLVFRFGVVLCGFVLGLVCVWCGDFSGCYVLLCYVLSWWRCVVCSLFGVLCV